MAHFSLLASIIVLLAWASNASSNRSFVVDYSNNVFLKDGEPFRYISGSMHYFRVPRQYWKDRMQKMRLAGLNALQTYVEWSGHEVGPDKFYFEGDYDLKAFLDTAKEVGLLVVLRPGPYICAERDNGGLPYWLLSLDRRMKYRSSDTSYISRVDKWFSVLLPMVKPYLYKNGGPIITVQIENEYGEYVSCDKDYMQHLVNITRQYLGDDVVLFRTNKPSDWAYECDYADGTLVTANFGSDADVDVMVSTMRRAMKEGPLVVTEYYPGSPDEWGHPHANVDQNLVLKTFEKILQSNASVNFYMFHGGTNFGFTNGANTAPQITSYDYGAPLTEAGDPTDMYFKIRHIVGRYLPLPNETLPVPAPKLKIGLMKLDSCATLDDIRAYCRQHDCIKPVSSRTVLAFEELGHASGYVLYTTRVPFRPTSPASLAVPRVKDRGYVFTSHTRTILTNDDQQIFRVPVVVKQGENVTILVENTGRINVGELNYDPKGITTEVSLDHRELFGFTMEPLPLGNAPLLSAVSDLVDAFGTSNTDAYCIAPGAYFGSFVLPEGQKPLDTFLDPTGWGKGVAFVNAFNLGRYWPSIGPQVTLYVPGALLRPYPEKNVVLLFETESAPRDNRTISFVDVPNIDGPVAH